MPNGDHNINSYSNFIKIWKCAKVSQPNRKPC